jgi:hypothetical protein
MRDRDSEPRMYKFDPRGEPPETAFRAIAIDQLDETLADLDRPDRAHRSVVHEARRRCKKLRGLLRLVRPGFADFDRENTAIRDAAALLSHLRDSEVMHETFHELSEWRHDPLFERLAAAAATDEPDQAPALAAFGDRLRDIRRRAETWTLSKPHVDTLVGGLRSTYRSGRRRMRKAARSDTATAFHNWRKASKYHGFHLDLLRKAAPEMIDGELDAVEALSTQLGQHHDLVVLRSAAQDHKLGITDADLETLVELIGQRLEELEDEAFELGRQVYAETPDAIARRISSYWNSAS